VELHLVDLRVGEDAVQSVQPAIRSPLERVKRFMRVLTAEAGEEDLLMIAAARALSVAQEEQVGRCSQEDAAIADLDAAGQVEAGRQILALRPDRDLVGLSRTRGIFQDLDSITWLLTLGSAFRIFVALHDPDPA